MTNLTACLFSGVMSSGELLLNPLSRCSVALILRNYSSVPVLVKNLFCSMDLPYYYLRNLKNWTPLGHWLELQIA